MIEIHQLTVRYPRTQRPAVDKLSMRIEAGEVFGFIGPNGAGKTSTLKVLAGLLAATSGSARVAGISLAENAAAVRAKVGYLPDFFGVYEDLTCREYLDFFGAAQGLTRDKRERAVGEALELVDLVEKADQLAGALSRGMQQRLGLARVLLHEPDVLLLDEPASGLDPRARVEVREVLRELGRMGKTIVLSSHVLADLAIACTSVGIIERGRLVYHGSVRDALVAAAPPECAVRVAVVEGVETLRDMLEKDPGLAASAVEAVDGACRIVLPIADGGSQGEQHRREAATLVASRVAAAGLSLVHLEIERVDLEQAFMTLTRGELA